MRAPFRVQAPFRQSQTFHRLPSQEMLRHDLVHVAGLDEAVPDRLRVHHHYGRVFTLIQAAGLIGPHSMLQTGILNRILESPLQPLRAPIETAGA